jgi:hypothetical protein
LQEAVTASSDITGPFISAVGEEAIIVAQQCGASRQQELEASKKKKGGEPNQKDGPCLWSQKNKSKDNKLKFRIFRRIPFTFEIYFFWQQLGGDKHFSL